MVEIASVILYSIPIDTAFISFHFKFIIVSLLSACEIQCLQLLHLIAISYVAL